MTPQRPVTPARAGAASAASPVNAAGAERTALGPGGQRLTVSAASGLDPLGQTVRVTGAGYDQTKGVYVALCKDNGDSRVPAPCAGGADTSGGAKSSEWIAPKGDPHARALGVPYGEGGGFDVELRLTAKCAELDCIQVACSVVTRVDHRGAGDRSQDVRVPIAFWGQDPAGPGGEGVDVPQGTVSYQAVEQFATAGKPRDMLLHPDSRKLYGGSEDLPDTADANESGLHVLDPADGTLRGSVTQAPGPTGAPGRRAVRQLIAPLPGDGVVFSYPLRGIGTAKDGDAAAAGAWVPGGGVTDAAPGVTPGTVLVAQGSVLSEVDIATAAVRRTLTLDGGDGFAVDAARRSVWFTDADHRTVYRVDTATFQLTATVELPPGEGYTGFTEVDPAAGAVWVGLDTSVVVHDADSRRTGVIKGTDLPRAARFDAATHRAYVVWQDSGDTSQPGSDNNGVLAVYHATDLKEAAATTVLPANHGQLGFASLAVAPGGAVVFVSNPAEGRIARLERSVSPTVTQGPTDRTVTAGERVVLTADAYGTPKPAVAWQVSADAGRTWQLVEGAGTSVHSFTAQAADNGRRYRAEFRNTAGTSRTKPITLTVTAAGTGTDGGTGTPGTPGTSGSGSGSGGTVGGTGATANDGSLASTGAGAATLATAAAALTATGWILVRRRRRTGSPRAAS